MAKDWSKFEFDDDPPDGMGPEDDDDDDLFIPTSSGRWAPAILLVASLVGVFFAGRSTADFVAHLDRDVHAIHCSLSLNATATVGHSGCRAVMLSPYSSFFREALWGGLPVSLWAIAVFAFLGYRSAHLVVRGHPKKDEGVFLLIATLLPCLMSVVYGYLAVSRVGEVCTTCVGIYIASGLALVGGIATLLVAQSRDDHKGPARFAFGVGEGTVFVAVLSVAYLGFVPDAGAGRGPTGCGVLVEPGDPANIMVQLSPGTGGVPSIELLDPLCPSCRAFDERLAASGLGVKLNQKAVLFPLDAECNWMLKKSLHPGACAVSEAMLCSPALARDILRWSFANQEQLLAAAKVDPKAVAAQVVQQFPGVRGCVGSTQAKNRLTKSLRWAVANALPVLTPQLFVNGKRMCDEDTDLGLEYTLSRMLKR